MDVPAAVGELAERLRPLGWVTELFVGGSAATGDYQPGVSDLDLVALVDGQVDDGRRSLLATVHLELDRTDAAGLDLGCVYVDQNRLADLAFRHPTWTHGAMLDRVLSGIARVELVQYGFAVMGREPQQMLPVVGPDAVRQAARAELVGYWTMAARHPTWWLDATIADLGLTSMARGRHALATGTLLTKTAAIEAAHAPPWLADQLRARRHGQSVSSPQLRTGWIAWRDARRTTAAARRWKLE